MAGPDEIHPVPTTTLAGGQPPDAAGRAAGEQPRHLHRGLKVVGTILITLSAITPASSVFIIIPGVVGGAGTGALWSLLAAGVVGVFMAFVYAELSSAYPLTGGEYAIVARTVGRLPGFLVLGLMLVTQLLILAVIGLGVGIYLGVLFPDLHPPTVAAITVLAAVVLGVLDIKINAVVTGIFLAIEMLALVVLSLLGFLNTERSVSGLLFEPVVGDGAGGLAPATLGMIGAATAVAIFAYNGYGSAVYLGEETRGARRGIAGAILWALGITVVAELVPTLAVLLGAPDLDRLLSAGNMMEYFITERGGAGLNTAISLGIAIAIVNAVLAILLLSARLTFSTARDNVWPTPVNRALRSLHPRFGTPWIATIVTGVIAAAVCYVDEQVLFVLTGTSLVVVYAALCVAAIAGRRNGTTAHGAYRMPLFPLPPVVGLAALGYVAYQSARDPEIGRPSLLVTLAVMALSAVYYVAVVRRRGRWELRGAETADE
ncbi:MAG TPA: APC family permease [Pilimelia sp.]|nr:APC family permease [Pilimelia sp.]